jgi:glycosyltransferase involved in cell wall biosynthesis
MRIGIDARPLSRQRMGIENYVHGLVQLLPQVAPEHEYFLYSNAELVAPVPERGIRKHIDRAFQCCPGSIWLLSRAANLMRRDELDVFWSTSTLLPRRMPAGVLKVVTVYDLVWRRFPETMTHYNFYVHKIFAEKAIARADVVVVISRSVRDELVHCLGVPEEKIRVVYPGISERYQPQDQSAAAGYISDKYGTPRRYLATVGTVHPRKNLRLLVQVLRILRESGRLDCTLLVAGAKGWKNSQLYGEIQAAGLTEQEIKFLGYVPDEDLPFFYAGAQLFLFPSLYEGFGIPPVEAMACGTPVVSSNAGSLPEVLGDAAILESPDSPERTAEAVMEGLANEELRRTLRARGINRSREFCWERSAGQLLGAFSNFSGSGARGGERVPEQRHVLGMASE